MRAERHLLAAGLATIVLAAPTIASAAPVTVWHGAGSDALPCAAPDLSKYPRVTGGCTAEMVAVEVIVAVQTAFGEIPFGTCDVSYTMHVDRRGRTLNGGFQVGGPSPCNDVFACWEDDDEHDGRLPWRGRIEISSAGRLEHRMKMCLDTCMGRFEGGFTTTLERTERGWRGRSRSRMVGTSGWEFDGAWRTRVRFDVRPAGTVSP